MNKIDFVLIYDALDANPNGDPDAGNMPRVDVESGHGLVTDVCLKRKIRNFVQLTRDGQPGCDIYVREKAILNNQNERAYQGIKKEAKNADQAVKDEARAWMCQNFFDIRAFGAVMTTDVNCGQVRGPVQLSFSRSVDPVFSAEYAVTRCAVTTVKEAENQKGDNRTMGRKYTIPYAVYTTRGCVNPFLAAQTGFNESDWELLKESLVHLFDFDASAARPAGSMAVRKLIVFKHESQLGNAPAHKLYDAVKIVRKEGIDAPRSIEDYDIIIDKAAIPAGVTVEEIDC
ncbi:type I-C CRISPR-associated protein Cas7/Csd2 [Akkermansia glycaniphila]|uniref:Cas csd2: crispr-associated protein cas7/csd2 subtype i-c/dvulg n=1 Tax=Akkermansia glycaniphila TaxID=1679444 RepID=A0A1C7PA34_9BACT|nr:type I-C CRISPR-associated protein Cas7/Csd2 [Akkermansia glycaniphila]MBT9449745.1 type I-C CRISPR-associated protein Cas7/Csd2 [Akkermansia glycaniphila]OCA02214.1 CRISPR-associated protein Csh2 [Akkermansia glycaniphila]SEH99092.1 cas csd2: crispr-associated protein cas7/csd2 subtype i-c/dvulg [Akkermansia glycaniphila]